MVDIHRALRSAAQTGKLAFGEREARKATEAGKAKLLIMAKNAPDPVQKDVESTASAKSVPIFRFEGMGTELGPACGKPFSVSVLAVLEAGDSDILALAKRK
ncbi:MAG: 50S ribosomal protein L30e [Methanobacteriota archaeon]